jgi:hypothetical protein
MLVILFASPLLGADDPKPAATPKAAAAKLAKPSTQPSPRVVKIQGLLGQLASDDFETRDAARVALMGLKRADLPDIREAIRRAAGLEPGQVVVLREVVTHVYLSGDPYPVTEDDDSGFLGVSLPSVYVIEDRGLAMLDRGVAIVSRVPGFCAYRMLQNGDVVLSMTTTADHERVTFNAPDQFISAVKGVRAGQSATFEVLRQGRVVSVTITLERRPEVLDRNRVGVGNVDVLRAFNDRRADDAAEMWERDFAPLLGERVG